MSRRPHLVIFNPDQWRGDAVGHLGHPAAVTPTLDALVKTDAVSFRWAFCQNPVCTPSRCSFMTGWYPHVRGHRTMFHMLRPDEPNLLRTLKDGGYHVWWGGKNDLVPRQGGFAHCCHVKHEPTGELRPRWGDEQLRWRGEPGSDRFYSFFVGRIDSQGQPYCRDHDWANVTGAVDMIERYDGVAPLCLYLPLNCPHPPYAVEDHWHDLIDPRKLPPRIPAPRDWRGKPTILRGIARRQNLTSWTEDRWNALRATYLGMCARVDHQLGLVLDALRRKGMYDDTALFFFSDHGDFTGDYGLVEKTQNTFEDCLTRVPLVVKPPRGVDCRPRVSDALVELIDFTATVEALTDLRMSHDHFGRSLLPVISGRTDEHRDAVFCEGGRRAGETQAMELESRQTPAQLYWPRVGLQQRLPDFSYAVMCRSRHFKYVHRLYEGDELYDLRHDPCELRNGVDDPAYAQVRREHRDRLLRFFMETADVVPRDTDQR